MKIAEVLSKMGYTEFIVRGDTYEGIEWIEQPEVVPTKEDIENAIIAVQDEVNVKATQKSAILERIGLTEEELQIVLNN
jgi:hypothetical protein